MRKDVEASENSRRFAVTAELPRDACCCSTLLSKPVWSALSRACAREHAIDSRRSCLDDPHACENRTRTTGPEVVLCFRHHQLVST